MDITKMFDHLNTAIVAADKDFKVVYQNDKCRKLFEADLGKGDCVGSSIEECHSPATTEKVKGYYSEYAAKKRDLDHYVTEGPNGKLTVVNVPVYEDGEFAGIVEFIFESGLA